MGVLILILLLLLCGCGPTDSAIKDDNTTVITDSETVRDTNLPFIADTNTTVRFDSDTVPQTDTVTSVPSDTTTTAGIDTNTDTGTEQGPPPNLGTTEWGSDTRIVAIGDNHADLSQSQRALQLAGLIDASLVWTGKNTIVVQLGDVIDRGTEEREVIDFYETLRPQAEAQGGQIINLLGNHEVMTALGDYRYMRTESCAAFADLTDLDISNPAFADLEDDCKRRAAAFWPGGPYAKIIADWPAVVVLEQIAFVHGGLHQKHVDYGIDNINQMTEAWLNGEGELDTEQVGGGEAVYSLDWDRVYSNLELFPTDEQCAELTRVLEQIGAVRMVVGHTVQTRINAVCDGRVVRIDTGMSDYYSQGIEVLEIIGDQGQVLEDPS